MRLGGRPEDAGGFTLFVGGAAPSLALHNQAIVRLPFGRSIQLDVHLGHSCALIDAQTESGSSLCLAHQVSK